MPPQSETTPLLVTPATTSQPIRQNATSTSNVTASEIVCIVIAAITLVLHIILLVLCAANLAVMKQIKMAVCPKTSPGVVRSPTITLPPLKQQVKPTTADYDAMRPEAEEKQTLHVEDFCDGESDMFSEKKQPIQTTGGDQGKSKEDRANNTTAGGNSGPLGFEVGIGESPNSFSKIGAGGSETSFDRHQVDSRSGSSENLLYIKPKKNELTEI